MVPRFAVWSGVLLSIWGCAACEREPAPPPQVVVRITPTAAPRLEDAFRALPDLKPQTVDADGSIAGVRALQAREIDLAVVMADIAYHAYIGQSGSETGSEGQIRGIAVLNVNTVYLAAARHSSINSIEDLRGSAPLSPRPWSSTGCSRAGALRDVVRPFESCAHGRARAEARVRVRWRAAAAQSGDAASS